MKYEDIRPTLKSGDLISSSFLQPAFSSWYAFKVAVVQAWTRSDISHVALVWVPPTTKRVWIIEAVVPCVRVRPLSQALDEGEDVYHTPMNCDWSKVEDFAFEHIGTPYSQLLAMVSSIEPWKHGKYTECAGLTIDIMNAAGIDLGNIATPQDILRHAMLRPGATQTLITK